MSFAHAWKCFDCRGKELKLFSEHEYFCTEASVYDLALVVPSLKDDVLGLGQEPAPLPPVNIPHMGAPVKV